MADQSLPPVTVTVRFFAAARAAAGVEEEFVSVPPPADIADVVTAVVRLHGDRLAQVLRRCSFLLDETAVHGSATVVRPGAVLDVLPPFAGG
ncbi:MAG: MoaD/ThiS family protein [Actinomycetota bacterium]|nr:MoaD/ThiS family protein [Actinomycetota bacterium]